MFVSGIFIPQLKMRPDSLMGFSWVWIVLVLYPTCFCIHVKHGKTFLLLPSIWHLFISRKFDLLTIYFYSNIDSMYSRKLYLKYPHTLPHLHWDVLQKINVNGKITTQLYDINFYVVISPYLFSNILLSPFN